MGGVCWVGVGLDCLIGFSGEMRRVLHVLSDTPSAPPPNKSNMTE